MEYQLWNVNENVASDEKKDVLQIQARLSTQTILLSLKYKTVDIHRPQCPPSFL